MGFSPVWEHFQQILIQYYYSYKQLTCKMFMRYHICHLVKLNTIEMNLFKDNFPTDTFKTVTLSDVVKVRQYTRYLAENLGFSRTHQTQIICAVTEICENVIDFANTGVVDVKPVDLKSHRGIFIKVSDTGPGILDISEAVQDGYSTRNRLGLGLPGTRRFMDLFKVESKPNEGTKVLMCKWLSVQDKLDIKSV